MTGSSQTAEPVSSFSTTATVSTNLEAKKYHQQLAMELIRLRKDVMLMHNINMDLQTFQNFLLGPQTPHQVLMAQAFHRTENQLLMEWFSKISSPVDQAVRAIVIRLTLRKRADKLAGDQRGASQQQSNARQATSTTTIPVAIPGSNTSIPKLYETPMQAISPLQKAYGGPYQPQTNVTQAPGMIPPSNVSHPTRPLTYSGQDVPTVDTSLSRTFSATLPPALRFQKNQSIEVER